jgi:hypothetical protein
MKHPMGQSSQAGHAARLIKIAQQRRDALLSQQGHSLWR